MRKDGGLMAVKRKMSKKDLKIYGRILTVALFVIFTIACFFVYDIVLVAKTEADIIGHFDLITKHAENADFFDFNSPEYLHYATEAMATKDLAKRRRDLERLRPALDYIEKNFSERISVDQLAQVLCLSTDRLGHLFRDGVGQAPLQYINEIRLRKAMNLLKTGAYTVTEVADAVGFQDYNHFGRLFRKAFGATPNRIRLETAEKLTENSGNV